jgi:hypothetical protein
VGYQDYFQHSNQPWKPSRNVRRKLIAIRINPSQSKGSMVEVSVVEVSVLVTV